jgi:hypothetical protein
MTPAERQRAYRIRKGAGDQRGPAASAPCGTVSAFKRHQRNNEPVDQPCRDAYNAEARRLYRQRQSA